MFQKLKFESGVHRVQRVPKTETQGRVHTSTATVAILPEITDVEVVVHERDLRIDHFRSGGPGGQHVNKTNSAVRVVHMPSGISIECQEQRCAKQNEQKARLALQQRLYKIQLEDAIKKRQEQRSKQVGFALRSDKIRTYNFAQNRITDHRLGLSFHSIDSFLAGRHLSEICQSLRMVEVDERLAEMVKEMKQDTSKS